MILICVSFQFIWRLFFRAIGVWVPHGTTGSSELVANGAAIPCMEISLAFKFWTQRVRIPALESHFNGLSLFGMGASFVSEMVIPYFQATGQIAM